MPSSADVTAGAAGSWRLGDRTVRRLGFGTMRLTGTEPFHAGRPRDRAESVAVLRRAVELGVDHLDTAAFYFSRLLSAPLLVRDALAPYPDDLTLVTKVGPARDASGRWASSATPEELRGQVEDNLRLLGTDHVHVVNFRATGGQGDVTAHVQALAELVDAGLVGAVGVSGVTPAQLDQARAVTDVVCVQNRGDDLPMLQRCGRLGIAFVPFFSVSGPARQGRPGAEPDAVRGVAEQMGATPAQVRLAWALALGEHVLVIPGTGSLDHLEQNVAAAALRLGDEQLTRLGAA